MSYQSNLQNLTDKEQELENLKEESEVNNFNTRFGLSYPDSVLTSQKPLWDTFFTMLKYYSELGVIPENEISSYYSEFCYVLDEYRGRCVSQLAETFERQYLQNLDVETILVLDQSNKDAEKLASVLSPEMREAFYYFINTGEELTPELRTQIAQELAGAQESEALERLQRAFDTKKTLNIGSRESQKGRALTADEVQAKFDLDESIESGAEVIEESQKRDPMAKISTKTQSLYDLVNEQRQKRIQKDVDKKDGSRFDDQELIARQKENKNAGLDDLLNK